MQVSASHYREPPTAKPEPAATEHDAPGRLCVLIAEDNPGDVYLVREALDAHGLDAHLIVKQDGEEMLGYIRAMEAGESACPDVILLDLNLPKHGGDLLLRRLRESPLCAAVPVVIVTSSDAIRDREMAARLGADSYFRKPVDLDEFLELGAVVKSLISGRNRQG